MTNLNYLQHFLFCNILFIYIYLFIYLFFFFWGGSRYKIAVINQSIIRKPEIMSLFMMGFMNPHSKQEGIYIETGPRCGSRHKTCNTCIHDWWATLSRYPTALCHNKQSMPVKVKQYVIDLCSLLFPAMWNLPEDSQTKSSEIERL